MRPGCKILSVYGLSFPQQWSHLDTVDPSAASCPNSSFVKLTKCDVWLPINPSFHIWSGTNQWVPVDLYLGVNRPGREAAHLHLVPRSRMSGAMPPLPQHAFMAWCSVKAQGQLYLYLTNQKAENLNIIKIHKTLVWKHDTELPLRRHRRTWEDNIKMDIEDTGYEWV
jgi:hypothetical protein